jgi:phosphatidylglycerol---prolipoprotein diacylglyceryl transferase
MKHYYGFIAGVFLLGYGIARFTIEFVREPDIQLGFIFGDWMSMGQVLCLPMMIVGAAVMWLALKRGRRV